MLRVSNKSAFPPPPLPPDITEALYTIHNAVGSRDVGSKCSTIQSELLVVGAVQSFFFFVLRHQFICISLIFERSHSLVRLLLQDRKKRKVLFDSAAACISTLAFAVWLMRGYCYAGGQAAAAASLNAIES
jgi:hypothetical protein